MIEYLKLAKNICAVLYNQNVIMLDLIKNQYIVFSELGSQVVEAVLDKRIVKVDGAWDAVNFSENLHLGCDCGQIIEVFLQNNLLVYSEVSDSELMTKVNSCGARNVDWMMRYGDLDTRVSIPLFLEIYIKLIQVHRYLEKKGLQYFIEKLRLYKSNLRTSFIPESSEADYLSRALNKVCFYFYKRVKCLEWAATYTMLAMKRNWRVNMVIGVQNFPFIAHSWAENGEGLVIADNPELNKELGVILREPFN